MMKSLKPLLAMAAALATMSGANAAIVIGTWANWVNAAPVTANCLNYSAPAAAPGGTSSVNWGDSPDVAGCAPQSGYDFKGIAMTNYVPSALIDIGDFTHRNQPVFGPSITGVDMNLNIRLDDGLGPQDVLSTIHFTHDETNNNASPCPYTPNNANGCSDRVSFPVSFSSSITLNGILYALQVVGFSTDGGLTFINDFVTLEGVNNKADIFARLVPVGNDCPPDCGPLPVPAPLTLIALGAGLIAVHRRWGHTVVRG